MTRLPRREDQQARVVASGAAGDPHTGAGELSDGDTPATGPAERAAVDLAAPLGGVGVEGAPGRVLVTGAGPGHPR
ncbi:hypothetical protein [Streptomyces murinus]|uniref:hypothetical protein n=1 Tax=Streptomyces murinus TaxID=33900 RepID=UPI0018F5E5C6